MKNKNFYLAIIPALLLLAQAICSMFGVEIDTGIIGEKVIAVLDAVFAILAVFGVVNDPTTAGLADSDQALTYSVPKK